MAISLFLTRPAVVVVVKSHPRNKPLLKTQPGHVQTWPGFSLAGEIALEFQPVLRGFWPGIIGIIGIVGARTMVSV